MSYQVPNTTGVDVDGNPIDPIAGGPVVTAATVILDEAMTLELESLQRVQNRANLIHNVWTTEYLPRELQTLAEVASVPKQTVNVSLVSAGGINTLNQTYAQADLDIADIQTSMCFSDVCGVSTRMAISKAKSQSWHVQADLRYEEVRVDSENSQRLNDRIAMIAPGRNQLTAALNALASASEIYGSVARQADANKGNSNYIAGRVLEFAKNNIGNIAKIFSTPTSVQNATTGMGSPTMYGPEFTASDPYGGGYQYDTGAELFGGSSTPYVMPSEYNDVTVYDIDF